METGLSGLEKKTKKKKNKKKKKKKKKKNKKKKNNLSLQNILGFRVCPLLSNVISFTNYDILAPNQKFITDRSKAVLSLWYFCYMFSSVSLTDGFRFTIM